MKLQLHTDCQIKIAYHWRKYIKRKKARLALEAAKRAKKLAAKNKGKKGKLTVSKKKKAATMKPKETKELTGAKTDKKGESL